MPMTMLEDAYKVNGPGNWHTQLQQKTDEVLQREDEIGLLRKQLQQKIEDEAKVRVCVRAHRTEYLSRSSNSLTLQPSFPYKLL